MSDPFVSAVYADALSRISQEAAQVGGELDKCLRVLGIEPQNGWTIWRRLVALRAGVEARARLMKQTEGYRQNAEANLKGLRKAQRRHRKALADMERLRARTKCGVADPLPLPPVPGEGE